MVWHNVERHLYSLWWWRSGAWREHLCLAWTWWPFSHCMGGCRPARVARRAESDHHGAEWWWYEGTADNTVRAAWGSWDLEETNPAVIWWLLDLRPVLGIQAVSALRGAACQNQWGVVVWLCQQGEEEDLSDDDKLVEAQPLGSYVLQDSNQSQ